MGLKNIDFAIYANLDYRKDRKADMEELFDKLDIKHERFSAISHPDPWYGGMLSFIEMMKRIVELDHEYSLICEDDVCIRDMDKFLESFNFFMNENLDWDVLMLGGNNKKEPVIITDHYFKSILTYACPAYLLKRSYYKTFLDHFMKRNDEISKDCLTYNHTLCAVDTVVSPLQSRDNWYMLFPNGVVQKPSFSDLSKRFMDHTKCMSELT